MNATFETEFENSGEVCLCKGEDGSVTLAGQSIQETLSGAGNFR